LNPKPSIEPLEDPDSQLLRDKMRLELDAYIPAAMTDLTNQRAGGKPATRPTELIHDIKPNEP